MAQERWIGLSGGVWSDAGNWSGGVVPGTLDDVAVDGTASGVDLAVSGDGAAGSLTVTGDVGVSGQVAVGTLAVGLGGAAGRLDVTGGGGVRAGSLTLVAGGTGSVTVGANAVLEVGGAGGAGVGTVTVDAGVMVAGAGSVSAVGGIVDNGVLEADGGTLTLLAGVSGSGQVRVGAGATVSFAGAGAPSAVPVTFLAGTGSQAGGTLEVGTVTYFDGTSTVSALSAQGVVTGFVAGDTIQYDGAALTGVSYADGGNGMGTLTLMSGSSVAGTLQLAGSYAGQTFQVASNGMSGSRIAVAASSGGATTGPSPGTVGPDTYVWTGSGSWGTAGNWVDTVAGPGPAGVAPGGNDVVTISGPASSFQTITGPGNAASLLLLGNTALGGTFNTGQLLVGNAGATGSLTLSSGTSLTAGDAAIADGSLQVNGGRLAVNGGLRLGNIRSDTSNTAPNVLALVSGGVAQVTGGLDLAVLPGVLDSVIVDSTSTLEIGSAGGVGAGQVQVDAGLVLAGAGKVSAPGGIVNNGTILAAGGTLAFTGQVSGSGTALIDTGATLSLGGSGAPSGTAVGFLGTGGTLAVGVSTYVSNGTVTSALSAQGVISGFRPGETIHDADGSATAVSYQAGPSGSGGPGTLTFLGGGGTVGTLSLAGDFRNDTFHLVANAGGGVDVSVTVNPPGDVLVDGAYVLAHYPQASSSGLDPSTWFHAVGWHQGANPNALFDTSYYLRMNPDVAAAGADPLSHYEQYGWMDGREPSAQFDGNAYLRHNPDVAAAHLDPLVHYIAFGQTEGRMAYAVPPPPPPPDPLVDAAYLTAAHPELAASGLDPVTWFHTVGWHQGANPDAFFDTNYYLHQNPDIASAGIDPLSHYESYGWHEGRAPSLLFSPGKYLAANPDVVAGGHDPLLHYLAFGQSEGRMAFLPGNGGTATDVLVDTAYYDAQLGATLIPQGAAGQAQAAEAYANGGWQHGLNPDASFDTAYYLRVNPDIAAAGINPLVHYEQFGWHEGRNPSAAFSTNAYLQNNADVAGARVDPLVHYAEFGHTEGRAIYAV